MCVRIRRSTYMAEGVGAIEEEMDEFGASSIEAFHFALGVARDGQSRPTVSNLLYPSLLSCMRGQGAGSSEVGARSYSQNPHTYIHTYIHSTKQELMHQKSFGAAEN